MATDTRPTTEDTPETRDRRRRWRRPTGRMMSSRVSTSGGWRLTFSRRTARAAAPDPDKEPFTIIQPPPNVTGALHVGHALTSTVEDVMVRRARMKGHPTLFLPGMDHASIAAQVVLDRILAEEGETRESLGRERYLERMWTFVNETRDVIADQQRRLGISVDWSRLRFTMDEGSAKAVRVAFKKLYDDGLAYRGEQLINWCPGCQTSLSDLEVVATPTTGHALVRPLPPRRRRRQAAARRDHHCGDHAPGDDPRRHRRGGSSGRCRATRPLVGRSGAHPVRRADRADHRRRRGASRSSAPARSRSRPPTTTKTSPRASATTCR